MEDERPPRWMVVGVYLYALTQFVFYVGLLAGVAFKSRSAMYTALAALAAVFTMHLVAAAIEYRKTMRRPWPKVAPLPDDDDD
jgi:hypothetical protein